MEIEEGDETTTLGFINLCPRRQSIWLAEYDLSMAIHLARFLTNEAVAPIEARFQHPDLGYAEEYEALFQCPVLFEQSKTELIVRTEDMLRKIVLHDPYLQSMIKKIAENQADRSGSQSTKDTVIRYIKDHLEMGQVSFEAVVKALNMDRNMLYRKLKSEGTTFKEILESTRKSLAKRYLKEDLTCTQISYLLGFSESSSFHHAFRRWFGISLNEYTKDQQI